MKLNKIHTGGSVKKPVSPSRFNLILKFKLSPLGHAVSQPSMTIRTMGRMFGFEVLFSPNSIHRESGPGKTILPEAIDMKITVCSRGSTHLLA